MVRNARTRNKDLQDQIGHLKSMLAQRKDRKRPVKLTDEEQEGLSREEQQRLMEARELQTESDRKREDQALLDARRLIEKVGEFKIFIWGCIFGNLVLSVWADTAYLG